MPSRLVALFIFGAVLAYSQIKSMSRKSHARYVRIVFMKPAVYPLLTAPFA